MSNNVLSHKLDPQHLFSDELFKPEKKQKKMRVRIVLDKYVFAACSNIRTHTCHNLLMRLNPSDFAAGRETAKESTNTPTQTQQ